MIKLKDEVFFKTMITPKDILKGVVVYIGFEGYPESGTGNNYYVVDTQQGKYVQPMIVYEQQFIDESDAREKYEKQILIAELEEKIREYNRKLTELKRESDD